MLNPTGFHLSGRPGSLGGLNRVGVYRRHDLLNLGGGGRRLEGGSGGLMRSLKFRPLHFIAIVSMQNNDYNLNSNLDKYSTQLTINNRI